MAKVNYLENKKYRIIRIDDFEIYAIKKHGLIYIYAREDNTDYLWLEEGYKDVKLQLRSEPFSDPVYCYLLLKDEYGICTIIEILTKKVKKSFNDNQCIKKYKRKIEIDDEEIDDEEIDIKEINDIVYVLWDKDDMWYSVWSLLKGYLFNTYEYTEIKQYSCGAILDQKIAVDIEGYSFDISSYKEINHEGVYYSKEINDYLYFLNDNRMLFVSLEENPNDKDVVMIELDDRIIRYNIEKDELSIDAPPRYEDIDWSQYNDIAYEGYSRQELGLDD